MKALIEKYEKEKVNRGNWLTNDLYDSILKDLRELEGKTLTPSFWFMTDLHKFIKPEGKSLKEITQSLVAIAKQHPYGMVCPVVILDNGKELRRVGPSVHVPASGQVCLSNWIVEVMKEPCVKALVTPSNDK